MEIPCDSAYKRKTRHGLFLKLVFYIGLWVPVLKSENEERPDGAQRAGGNRLPPLVHDETGRQLSTNFRQVFSYM